MNQRSISQVTTSPSSSRNGVVTQTAQPMVNPVIVHSPIQHMVNIVVANIPTHSQVVTSQVRETPKHPIVKIPPSRVTLPQLTTTIVQ